MAPVEQQPPGVPRDQPPASGVTNELSEIRRTISSYRSTAEQIVADSGETMDGRAIALGKICALTVSADQMRDRLQQLRRDADSGSVSVAKRTVSHRLRLTRESAAAFTSRFVNEHPRIGRIMHLPKSVPGLALRLMHR